MRTTKSIKSIKEGLKISFHYNNKKYTIDVTKELEINPNLINNQLEQAPSNYAFLCLVRDRYVYKRDKLERHRDATFSEIYAYYKNSGKLSNDLVENMTTTHNKVQAINKRLDKAIYNANKLISICRAFEQRDKILQTISANLRRQQ